MIVLSLMFLLPYWLIISASFTDEMSLMINGYKFFPKDFSLYAYEYIFRSNNLMVLAIWNSIKMTVLGCIITTATCMLFAYPLSKSYLYGKKFFTWYILITMLFSGGTVPYFLVVSSMFDDSMWAIILPGAMSAWNAILIKNFYLTIPSTLEEAAKVDGANDFVIFLRIYFPVSFPIMATIILFSAVGIWNNWFGPMLFITSREKYPIQYLIQQLMSDINNIHMGGNIPGGDNELVPAESIKMASVVLGSLPIIMVYPFLQKYFINGIIMGSVKE